MLWPSFLFFLIFLIFLIFISFHVYGLINNNIGNNSSLPANISKIITILERFEYIEKFPVGPTILSPGPILFNVATTAVKLLVKSKLSYRNDQYRKHQYKCICDHINIDPSNNFMFYNSSVEFDLTYRSWM